MSDKTQASAQPLTPEQEKSLRQWVASEWTERGRRVTSKSCWKGFERRIATAWGTKRTPLSGANSGHGGGDIILTGYDALVEAKVRAKFEAHRLFQDAQQDAKKHGVTPEHVFLYTHKKGERHPLVTMDAETFHLLVLPYLKPHFKLPQS